jgi:hypothetical protein
MDRLPLLWRFAPSHARSPQETTGAFTGATSAAGGWTELGICVMIMNQYSAGELLTGEDAVVRLVGLLGQGDARRVLLHFPSLGVPSRLWRLTLPMSGRQGAWGGAT